LKNNIDNVLRSVSKNFNIICVEEKYIIQEKKPKINDNGKKQSVVSTKTLFEAIEFVEKKDRELISEEQQK